MPAEQSPSFRKLKHTYNAAIVHLRKQRKQLRDVPPTHYESESPPSTEPEPIKYHTGFGHLTFEEIDKRTRRVAGSILRNHYNVMNPDDLDDCLQSGYLKIWQKLQDNPDMFNDKNRMYVTYSIVMYSKAQRYAHLRHYRKLVYDAEPDRQGDLAVTINRVETWIDLANAIHTATIQAGDVESELLGLYATITQVTMKDLINTSPYGRKKLTKARDRMRAIMAGKLEGYRGSHNKASNTKEISVDHAPISIAHLVTETGWQGWQSQPDFSQNGHRFNGEHHRALPTYPTRWNGHMSFEALYHDDQIRRSAYVKAIGIGIREEDFEDCYQQGMLALWHKLNAEPSLLADKGPVWAGIFTIFSGSPSRVKHHYDRQVPIDTFEDDRSTPDERLLVKHKHSGINRSRWVQRVEARLDLEQFMQMMCERYDSEPEKIIALYALTTSVRIKDIECLLKIPRGKFSHKLGQQVQADIQNALTMN